MEGERLLCVLAHPGDESLAVGGTLARYAAEGVETHLVVATRGEHGWPGAPEEDPGPRSLAVLREAELHAAAATLGVRGVEILGYPDGRVEQVDPTAAVACLSGHLRRVRPRVVITFPPDGITGHPDHIAVSQLTTAAVILAADPSSGEIPAHRVAKLYYLVASPESLATHAGAFGGAAGSHEPLRQPAGWPAWAITTRIDAADYWRQVCRAVACHQTQMPHARALARLPPAVHRRLWGHQEFYRVFSLVNTGLEHDLFAGLRHPAREPPP